ncbi:MAG: hypothetical protein J6X92_03920, partial [Bacteroidales bacterium]|nr:hypothetical protein [Bacteroidales bacterium]
MKYFLEQVAKQIYESCKNDLSRQCVVFPNRRSGLFFMEYLSALSDKPVWAPKTITINELFIRCSDLKVASTELLVYELYKIYVRLDAVISIGEKNQSDSVKIDETFDSFYFWGEMLVNDFDDIDKYIVNAKDLYTNLKDLHDIDDRFGGLSREQIEIIRKFIVHFSAGEDTPQKRDFEFNWSILYSLYNTFKKILSEKGLAYEGMIAREISENSLSTINEKFDCDRFHFVGFNALNNCEKRVLKYLKGENKASFYWDYGDTPFFKDDQKSIFFMKPDIEMFGQDFSFERRVPSADMPIIKIIDIPSAVGQAKLLPTLLSDFEDDLIHGDQQKTAIILADENLMPAVLSSIPSYIEDVNITMGYSFSMTPVYSLIKSLLYIQQRYVQVDSKNYYDHKSVLSILSNPLVKKCAGDDAQKKSKEIVDGNKLYVQPSFFADNEFL